MSSAKSRSEKFYLSEKQLDRVKRDVAKSVTNKAILVTVAATADVLGLTEEQLGEIAKTTERYCGYVDEHKLRLEYVRQCIKKTTGIDLGEFGIL